MLIVINQLKSAVQTINIGLILMALNISLTIEVKGFCLRLNRYLDPLSTVFTVIASCERD